MLNRDMGTGKDKHLIFRDEEVVIPNVRVFGDTRISDTIKENLRSKITEVLKRLAGSQSMLELKEELAF